VCSPFLFAAYPRAEPLQRLNSAAVSHRIAALSSSKEEKVTAFAVLCCVCCAAVAALRLCLASSGMRCLRPLDGRTSRCYSRLPTPVDTLCDLHSQIALLLPVARRRYPRACLDYVYLTVR
jgi:hypothetical protein